MEYKRNPAKIHFWGCIRCRLTCPFSSRKNLSFASPVFSISQHACKQTRTRVGLTSIGNLMPDSYYAFCYVARTVGYSIDAAFWANDLILFPVLGESCGHFFELVFLWKKSCGNGPCRHANRSTHWQKPKGNRFQNCVALWLYSGRRLGLLVPTLPCRVVSIHAYMQIWGVRAYARALFGKVVMGSRMNKPCQFIEIARLFTQEARDNK